MKKSAPINVYFVLGEESGDALGAEIIEAFRELAVEIEPQGLAGGRMQQKGMTSLFDFSELSVMGVTGVIRKLPNLIRRINQTAQDIIEKNPDVLLLIDSPDFSYRVARKVRRAKPEIKIVKFVAPTVWAWRPGRAKKIAPYIDHILAILPFEPALMKKLGGPETTYVGHPLSTDMPEINSSEKKTPGNPVRLLVLPGSRRSEIRPLLPIIKQTLARLKELSDLEYEITLPAIVKLQDEIRKSVSDWPVVPKIIVNEEAKRQAFREADVALCASGTVTLELATYKVPMISIYQLDRIMMAVRSLITTWTAALPNLIADYPFIPERMNEYANPENLSRLLLRLSEAGPERDTQLRGFDIVAEKMQQDTPSHILAVRKIVEILDK